MNQAAWAAGTAAHAGTNDVAANVPATAVVEPISPELVLVDPDLARDARARLAASADIATLRHVVQAATVIAPSRRKAFARVREHVVFAALGVSIGINGLLAAVIIGGGPATRAGAVDTTTRAAAVPTRTIRVQRVAAASVVRVRKASPPRKPSHRPPRRARADNRLAERRVLAAAFRAPRAVLPANLIDPTTGLPKNNLQIVCRRRSSRLYRCTLRVGPGGAPRVVVRYKFHRRDAKVTRLRDLGVR